MSGRVKPSELLGTRTVLTEGDDLLYVVECQDRSTQVCDACLGISARPCQCSESKLQQTMYSVQDAAGVTVAYAFAGAKEVFVITAKGVMNIGVNTTIGSVVGGLSGAISGAVTGAFWTAIDIAWRGSTLVAKGTVSALQYAAGKVVGATPSATTEIIEQRKPNAKVDAAVQVELLTAQGTLPIPAVRRQRGSALFEMDRLEQSVAVTPSPENVPPSATSFNNASEERGVSRTTMSRESSGTYISPQPRAPPAPLQPSAPPTSQMRQRRQPQGM